LNSWFKSTLSELKWPFDPVTKKWIADGVENKPA
jgi:hypothetical protein